MSRPIIDVRNVSKVYRLGAIGATTLKDELAGGWRRWRHGERAAEEQDFWALRDVSFEVQPGEVVGIIGRNGAGKSTLLKIISRITQQTSGEITLRGRVASLLEVGTGFHPDLTGRENIFLNGAILGMTRSEIRGKLDEIVAFAEVDRFLDTPVKRYSSGMSMRLAFAVAAHLEPEILVVDEVLAVGDAAFQRKCMGKIGSVASGGRTVVFVSHNMTAIQNLCKVAHFLDGGRLMESGLAKTVVTRYLATVSHTKGAPLRPRQDRQGDGRLRFTELIVRGVDEGHCVVACGDEVSIEIQYESETCLSNVTVSVGVYNVFGEGVLYLSNEMADQAFAAVPSRGSFFCAFGKLPLLPGAYSINLYCAVNGILSDWVIDAGVINVAEGDYFGTGRLPPKGYGALAVAQRWGVSSLT